MLNFIPDGYTEAGFIKAAAGLHSDLRFKFRPMLVADRATLLTAAAKIAPDLQQKAYGQAMTARLSSWDLQDSKGAPVMPTEDVVCRLRPALFNRLFDVISGLAPSDPDPDSAPEAPTVDEQARLKAAIAGVPYGDVKAEADLKN